MVITRTPFRVSFAGGGSDLPDYYKERGGAVVSCAINKYMYICVSKNFNKVWKISYSSTEYAKTVDEIQHDIVKAILKRFPFDSPLDIVSISDMPEGSGIGTSSAYTVGLINALMAYSNYHLTANDLARIACEIEIDILGKPIGKQDQYASAYGGLNYITFNKDGSVSIEPIDYKYPFTDDLLLVNTGSSRQATMVLSKIKRSGSNKFENLDKLKGIADELRLQLKRNLPPYFLAASINEGWKTKKMLDDSVSSPKVERIIAHGLNNGAVGAKLLGAGAEGFVLFYCTKTKQAELIDSFISWDSFINFKIDKDGSKVIYHD